MSIETDLFNLLKVICPRTYPDVAPSGTVTPYVTWQGIGGVSLRYTDGTAADKRNTFMQISVWSKARLEANTLIRQIEDALCTSSAFTVEPQGEPMATYEADSNVYGSIQRFSIYSSR